MASLAGSSASSAPLAVGRLFTTHPGGVWRRGDWWRWYGCRSKRVWFRLEPGTTLGSQSAQLPVQLSPQLRYRGRLIVQQQGLRAWLGWPWSRRLVVWTDWPKHGWGEGPQQTNYYLCLWTRWTWLHPRAALQPSWFTLSQPEAPRHD